MTLPNSWEKRYEEAVLETDWSKLERRIQAALSAIDDRLNELAADNYGTPEERAAIADALSGLSVLRRELRGNTTARA